MTKRLFSIFGLDEEKVKSILTWILIAFSAVGVFNVYTWYQYWQSDTQFWVLNEDQIAGLSTATIGVFVLSCMALFSAFLARRNYREATHLKEVEKGYHEPIVSRNEPISNNYAEQEEKRDFKMGISRNGRTDFINVPMTSSQVISALKRMPLTANQIRLYMEDYKTWGPVMEHLEDRKELAALQMLDFVPNNPKKGETLSLPV